MPISNASFSSGSKDVRTAELVPAGLVTNCTVAAPTEPPPPEIVEKLNREIDRILHAPAGVAWADSQGLEAIGGSVASFAATIENDRSRWTGAVKKLGVVAR